jgi:hypothetical protein
MKILCQKLVQKYVVFCRLGRNLCCLCTLNLKKDNPKEFMMLHALSYCFTQKSRASFLNAKSNGSYHPLGMALGLDSQLIKRDYKISNTIIMTFSSHGNVFFSESHALKLE